MNEKKLKQNEEILARIMQGKNVGIGASLIDTSRQQQMNFAIKQVEETLAANNNKLELTGLEKWQLAVKYVAMRRNPEAVNFLGRYGA